MQYMQEVMAMVMQDIQDDLIVVYRMYAMVVKDDKKVVQFDEMVVYDDEMVV